MTSVLSFLAGVVGWISGQAGLLNLIPHAGQVAISALSGLLAIIGIRGASSAPPTAVEWLNKLGSGWKTAAGILIAFVGTLLSPDVLGTLSPGVAHVVTALGTVLTALGLYHAQTALKA